MITKSSADSDLSFLDENYREIKENIAEAAIKSGRKPDDVRLMAVTKTVNPVNINHVIGLGADLIGENKVQELLGKLEFLDTEGVDIHIIGHLQSNKVRKIINIVSMIESVDSLSVANEISRQAGLNGHSIDVLLEVNIGREEAKTGIFPELLSETAAEISEMPGICIKGLMCVPPVCESESEARKYFAETKLLYEDIKSQLKEKADMSVLSMGMSSDYVSAVLEGSNLVRVGSSLFGARRY